MKYRIFNIYRIAHRLDKGLAQKDRERGVTVLRKRFLHSGLAHLSILPHLGLMATISTTRLSTIMVTEETSAEVMHAALVDVLEEEIVLGWLQPRERLVEEELSRRFATKRHLVREAIFELERMGLVERVPNKGAVVRSLDPLEVRQVYDVRIALE